MESPLENMNMNFAATANQIFSLMSLAHSRRPTGLGVLCHPSACAHELSFQKTKFTSESGLKARRNLKWGGFESLGGASTSVPTVAAWGSNHLDVFALGTDSAAWHKWWNGGAWSGWESQGGIFESPVDVCSWDHNRLDFFGLGTKNAAFHKSWEGSRVSSSLTLSSLALEPQLLAQSCTDISTSSSQCSAYEPLGGIFTSPVKSVSWEPERLDLFAAKSSGPRDLAVVGRGTDSASWINQWSGSWTEWQSLGGNFISEPSIVSWGRGRYDLFGIGIDGAMYHRYYANGSWSASWENLGGVLVSAPTAVSWGANRHDIFALRTDDAVWHNWWDGPAWGGWERLD
ncbi:sialidase [Drepanopeziza brunnea f. sp. 'multigermtubi' MB_m1]|uniref:Sialidase n=1 Tax=Marssonina brunnea f. sp. multigermtubi (strain MB_m1) TaxID=1072389 RepID=K1WWA2_MARBU|nr:sialidase [Drepanopeziza brunnea f. sp. 'multigermtubi' MB_m1]EKD12963.1 sialidase [Drepanopeziza brunnea f. sp. 'multigermtubi' MB_m1]